MSDFLERPGIVPGCVGMAGLLALGRIVGSCLAASSRPAVVTMPTHPGIVSRGAARLEESFGFHQVSAIIPSENGHPRTIGRDLGGP